jgi:hypothetical protein
VYRAPDWVIWQFDNLIAGFKQREANIEAGMNWTVGTRHELRLRLQSIAIDARLRQGYRVDPSGDPIPTNEAIDDFTVNNLAFQIRYRYEIAPLSYLYVVYGRGGFEQRVSADDFASALGDSFSLRDDEQLLMKISYRFE